MNGESRAEQSKERKGISFQLLTALSLLLLLLSKGSVLLMQSCMHAPFARSHVCVYVLACGTRMASQSGSKGLVKGLGESETQMQRLEGRKRATSTTSSSSTTKRDGMRGGRRRLETTKTVGKKARERESHFFPSI